jgi:hypothetical protein
MARRRCGVGCLLARAARARGEGSRSDTEAWRDEENAPRVGRPIGRVNVDDSVAAVPHTPRRTMSRVGSRGRTLVVTNAPLRIVHQAP